MYRIRRAAQRAVARGDSLDAFAVGRVEDHVAVADLDELRHMNNGTYLSLLDHARLDLLERTGIWPKLRAANVYPVVSAQTISYRKSLNRGQRFAIESRVLGFDERSVVLEQRFVVGDEVYARAFVAGRFLRDAGGVVPLDELGAIVGVDPAAHPVPEWMHDWLANITLPSTKAPAPNDWA
jgi:YbgC/YbaW family acyl-CoA thioester hydrolase